MKGAGVTLIEMLIVLAIIGILAALGFMSYLNYRNTVLLSDSLATVTQAFSRAVSTVRRTSRGATITFNTTDKTVTVTSNATTVASNTLSVDTLSITCRTSCPSSLSFDLPAPGGATSQDLSISMTLGNKTTTLRILGPSAIVVRS